jgi:hypothetical protein
MSSVAVGVCESSGEWSRANSTLIAEEVMTKTITQWVPLVVELSSSDAEPLINGPSASTVLEEKPSGISSGFALQHGTLVTNVQRETTDNK